MTSDAHFRRWFHEMLAELLVRAHGLPDLLLPTLLSAAIAEFDFADIDRSMWSRAMDLLPADQPEATCYIVWCVVENAGAISPDDLERLVALMQTSKEVAVALLRHDEFEKFPLAKSACLRGADHKSAYVRALSLTLLSEYWPSEVPSALDAILDAVGNKDEEVRRAASRALAFVDWGSAAAPLMSLLTDASPRVRRSALVSCSFHRRAESQSTLLLALRDPDPNVRVEACIQLASIGRAEVIPELFSKGNDPSEKVRHAALHAIVRLDRQYALGNVDRFCRLLEGRDASGYRWIFDPLTDEEWNGLDHGVKIAWQGYGPEQLVDPDEQWDEATQALWESGFYGLDADGDDDHQDHWDDVFFERVEAGFGNTNEDLAEINELLRLLTPEEPFSGFSDK